VLTLAWASSQVLERLVPCYIIQLSSTCFVDALYFKAKEGKEMDFGYCEYHGRQVNENEYRWKGCWGCLHFRRGKDFPYMDVSEVSKRLKVSENTVRKWIKEGKLEGEIFRQGRKSYQHLPSPPKYHIKKESVEKYASIWRGKSKQETQVRQRARR
jgi:excisionase family DNA binding protein